MIGIRIRSQGLSLSLYFFFFYIFLNAWYPPEEQRSQYVVLLM